MKPVFGLTEEVGEDPHTHKGNMRTLTQSLLALSRVVTTTHPCSA